MKNSTMFYVKGGENMASSQPIVRQINWISIIPQLIILILTIFVFYFMGVKNPILCGYLTYTFVFMSIRYVITKYHRKGMRFVKNIQYDNAIQEFQKSHEFFMKHKWIDKYRYVVLISSSRMSYLEMSMLNMAYCYAQLGKGSKSKELYKETLDQFPDSKMAESALKMFDSAKDIKD